MTAKEIATKAAALGGWEIWLGTFIRRPDEHGVMICPLEALELLFSGTSPEQDHANAEIIRAADNSKFHDPELRRILLTGVTK